MLKIDDKNFKNLELEKLIISGILKFPDKYIDLSLIIKPEDFYALKLHSIIWSIYGEILKKHDKVDYALIALKLDELHIKTGFDLSNYEYLEALFFISGVNEDNLMALAAKLKALSGKKNLADAAINVANLMSDSKNDLTYEEAVKLADNSFYEKINLFESGGKIDEPIDIFATLEAEVESESNEDKSREITCPFPRMEKLYGSFIPGELYFWCARPKASKSTFLMNLALQCSVDIRDKVKCLYLDTELDTRMVKFRLLSAITGINEYYLRTKKWRHNPEMEKIVRNAWPVVKQWEGLISHLKVGNMPMEEVITLMRRWVRKNSHDDYKIMVFFDYIKLGDEFHKAGGANMRPDLVLGRKVDLLKKAAEELGVVVCSAAQNNRSGEVGRTGNSADRVDSGLSIGQSDQIGQFSSSVYILGALTTGELQELDSSYGIKKVSHFCKNIYSRSQGEEAPGFNNLIKIDKGGGKIEWKENTLYYNIDSFLVKEIGDLASFVKPRKEYRLNSHVADDGEVL